MSRPKIGIIENSIDVTGALKSVAGAAYTLKNEFDFEFIIPRNSKTREWIKRHGFSVVHELDMREINKNPLRIVTYLPVLLLNAFRLKTIIRQRGLTLLHVNDIYNLLPVALRLTGCTIPYVCHIRFLPDRFPKWLFNFWLTLHLKFAHKIISVSKSVQRMLPEHAKLVMIYDPLPLEELYPVATQVSGDQHVFLYLSNFIKGKGQDFALEAFARIAQQVPGWSIRFVGGDMGLVKNRQFEEQLKLRARELKIWEKTRWSGFTEDVEREYKQADIVLNFSESESFSITCAEASFFGVPLIATDCGGPAEIVDHGQTGLIVPNRNVEAMAAAMLSLAENKPERGQLAHQARIRVREKFSISNTSGQLKRIYEDALFKES